MRSAVNKPTHVTRGNVMDELGFAPENATALKFKAELYRAILKYARKYSQKDLQVILGEPQPRVSELLNGGTTRVDWASRLRRPSRRVAEMWWKKSWRWRTVKRDGELSQRVRGRREENRMRTESNTQPVLLAKATSVAGQRIYRSSFRSIVAGQPLRNRVFQCEAIQIARKFASSKAAKSTFIILGPETNMSMTYRTRRQPAA